jgi:hypothetical protein
MLWLDAYERRARLAPGLLALVAVAFTITALGLRKVPTISIVVSLLSAAGGPILLASYVRKVGLEAQGQLWSLWGGPPTTTLLRLRETSENPLQRDIWRQALEAVTGVGLANAQTEDADRVAADNAIGAAINQLRAMTRTDQFVMVAEENKNYGYHRNLYGLRKFGRGVAGICAAVLIGASIWRATTAAHTFQLDGLIAGLVIDLALLLMWIVLPSADQVRQAGIRYAEQLLQAAVTLHSGDTGSA